MRTVSPETFADDFFGQEMDILHRLLWLGLILRCADDQGRLLDNAARIRVDVFPFDDLPLAVIDNALAMFENKKKILRYTGGLNGSAKQLIQILNWWKYQRSASWMAASHYVAPDGWIDRYRFHAKSNEIKQANWDQPGGFVATMLPSALPSALPTPLPSREDEDEDEDEDEVEVERAPDSPRETKPNQTRAQAAGSPALTTSTAAPTHARETRNRTGKPQAIGDVLSKVGTGGKPYSVTGYTQSIPEAILEGQANAGAPNAEAIYQAVTSLPTFPSNIRDDAIRIIMAISQDQHLSHAGAVAYLAPYFDAYTKRVNKQGRTYSKTGLGWLEWALAGSIPESGPAAKKQRNVTFHCVPDCPICKGTAKVTDGPCPRARAEFD